MEFSALKCNRLAKDRQMDEVFLPTSGLWLMFALGLRHGLDPDHIAMIDNMTYRLAARPSRIVAWSGTLFALGHGLAVTAIAVALGAFAGGLALPAALRLLLDWLPTALLLLVGTLNLRELLAPGAYRPRGWKTGLLPQRLRDSSHPLSIVLVGVVFALVFDTATQAAAWGYAAKAGGGAQMALLAGLCFTAGMVITDTADSRLVTRLLRGDARRAGAYRRGVGWAVVLMSYAMAAYEIGVYFQPGAELDDLAMSIIGGTLLAAVLAACVLPGKRTGLPSLIKEKP